MITCDKCGKPGPKENDAVELEILATNDCLFMATPRHLEPVEGCEGSPSRWRRVLAKEEPWYSAGVRLKDFVL